MRERRVLVDQFEIEGSAGPGTGGEALACVLDRALRGTARLAARAGRARPHPCIAGFNAIYAILNNIPRAENALAPT